MPVECPFCGHTKSHLHGKTSEGGNATSNRFTCETLHTSVVRRFPISLGQAQKEKVVPTKP